MVEGLQFNVPGVRVKQLAQAKNAYHISRLAHYKDLQSRAREFEKVQENQNASGTGVRLPDYSYKVQEHANGQSRMDIIIEFTNPTETYQLTVGQLDDLIVKAQ